MITKKRCGTCRNQLEKLYGHYYCHSCDIDDIILDEYHKNCKCDYCQKRRKKK